MIFSLIVCIICMYIYLKKNRIRIKDNKKNNIKGNIHQLGFNMYNRRSKLDKKIIYIADIYFCKQEVSQNRYDLLKYLSNLNNINVIHAENINNNIQLIKNCDYIIFYLIRPDAHISSYNIFRTIPFIQNIIKNDKIYFFIEDIYHTRDICKITNRFKIYNIILSMKHKDIKNNLLSYNQYLNIKEYSPLIDNSIFKFPYNNLKEIKKYDILIYGHMHKNIYPLRRYLLEILKKYNDTFKIKVISLSDGDYKLKDGMYINEGLSTLISQSYLTLTCNSKYDFLLKKYLEIPFSGSMILGNIPSNYDFFFNENTIEYVDIFMEEHEIIDKIKNALRDKDKLLQKTYQLYQSVKHFNFKNSSLYLDKLLN